MDKQYVPGTRLRFEKPMDIAFGGDVRHDLLLTINNFPVLASGSKQVIVELRYSLSVNTRDHSMYYVLRTRRMSQSWVNNLEIVITAGTFYPPGAKYPSTVAVGVNWQPTTTIKQLVEILQNIDPLKIKHQQSLFTIPTKSNNL
jgi:hypothetical protein